MKTTTFLALLPLLVACGGSGGAPPQAAPQGARDGTRTTEAFRAHHAVIRARLDETAARAMALPSAPPEEVGASILAIVRFFHHELLPHAQAEERVLYAAADRLVPTGHGRRYTDGLRYEHTVVAREIAALHDAMRSGDHSPEALAAIQRRTLELVGLVKAHFGVEEDVVLTIFDERMSAEEFEREVVAPMHDSGGGAHEHGQAAHGEDAHEHGPGAHEHGQDAHEPDPDAHEHGPDAHEQDAHEH